MSRNELCACGSGKRYKHCHGLADTVAPAPSPTGTQAEAFALLRAGSRRKAEALYRKALEANPGDVEVRHMLGVVLFERMRYHEALGYLWDAAERSGWADAIMRQHMGLVLARLLSPRANVRQEALVAGFLAQERERATGTAIPAHVSVVLHVYNQARFVARAIASVAAQSYRDIELVVIDDGSTDGTSAVITEQLSKLQFPVQFASVTHRGAAHAANEGASRATGRYLAFLAGDEWFAPVRIERMVAAIARAEPLWGYSLVAETVDVGGAADDHQRAQDGLTRAGGWPVGEPRSFTLLKHDISVANDNLFVHRDLFRDLGGFRDVLPHRGWDFCARAAEVAEPVFVGHWLYHRSRMSGTGARVDMQSAQATERRAKALLVDALTREAPVRNEFCPQFAGNRDLLLRSEFVAYHGDQIPVAMLRAVASTFLGTADTAPARPAAGSANATASPHARRIALVVLGVYRSGTSALARVLNLCGAMLPERVMAARLGLNPRGFWETEAVNDLNARLLHQLGGDWDRIGFTLPHSGPLVDEFLAETHDLLAGEYANAPFILIKDPRICAMAPLWHRALKSAGYQPAYVLPVRNPLEIARSLETPERSIAEGLALWLAYMQRVESFVDGGGIATVCVRYDELLDDWRRVVRRIARRLDVPLTTDANADEVDRFLERGMQNQQASDAQFQALLPGAPGDAARAMYRRLLERCERDQLAGQD
jgi:tetratricopeptide (TPR) repeat protein